MRPFSHVSIGKSAEDAACRHLARLGYAVVARRYRTRHGEIDIVARDGDVLVFIEVKARASDRFGTALEAVTTAKQGRLVRMATDYLARHGGFERPCRFDVVGVDLDAGGRAGRVSLVRDAFAAGQGGWRR